MKTKMILDIKKLGKNLKKLRTDSDFSQRELAEKMGQLYGVTWNKAMISKWESGKTLMNLENLVAYSKYFDIKIDKLLYENIM
jgi:DNA-binding helix-turn-helix protein